VKKFFFSDRIGMEMNGRMYNSSSRSNSRRSSNDPISENHPLPYSILTGPKNPADLVDCQIILVNVRQRFYLLSFKKKIFFSSFTEIMQRKLNLDFVLMVL
jgi:hypothetical protein